MRIPKKSIVNTFLFSIIMMAILLCCSSRVQAVNERQDGDYKDGDYIYTVTDGKAKIKGYIGDGGVVTIPSILRGNSESNKYPVTSIGESAFNGCKGLTILTIPQGVTEIKLRAFCGFEGLTDINIPEGVTSIGISAFEGCTGLTSIKIPQSVTSIGEEAFRGCTNLTSVNIPPTITSIGMYTFYSCMNLKNISIPKGVTTIGSYAFYDCKSLTSINIPEGVTSMGYRALYGCTNLTSITIPQSVTTIGESAFNGCRGLTSITIPQSVTSIGNGAFYDCSSLTSITIPQSVTTIGESAFNGCRGLTSITIPQSVTSISKSTFFDCSKLTSAIFNSAVTKIYDDADVFPAETKIIGYDPSIAKSYATKYKHTFEAISNPPDELSSAAQVLAPKVTLDGTTLSFDVCPTIENGRTLVPLRAIFEAMGAEVTWDSETSTVTAVNGNTTVVLTIGSLSPTINGKVKSIDVAGKIVDGRTLAPLRFVCEAFGGTVEWVADTQTANIKSAR